MSQTDMKIFLIVNNATDYKEAFFI